MKPAELKTLINECVREVMNEEKATKKKAALKKIQEIISENEIEETEVNELFGSKPASDQELDAYLAKNPKLKASLDKMDPAKAKTWRDFVKTKKASRIKNDEAILNVTYDEATKSWKETAGPSGGKSTGFSESKK